MPLQLLISDLVPDSAAQAARFMHNLDQTAERPSWRGVSQQHIARLG